MLTINPVFAPANASTGAITPTLDFEAAVYQAIDFYERTFTNNLDITITFAEAPIGGGLAQSQSYGYDFSYAQVKSALQALTGTADQVAAGKSLPTTDPFGATDGGNYFVTAAEAAALGLAPGTQPNAGYVYLGSTNTWTFDQTKVRSGTGYDAVSAMEHEISEVLGRVAGSDGSLGNDPLNLFRYTGPGAIDTSTSSTSPTAFFSVDGQHMLAQMGESGGDIADWGPAVSGDAFGFGTHSVVGAISAVDIREMNILGYSYTAGFSPTAPVHETKSQTTNGSGQIVETVKVYSYGALAGTVTVTFGATSATVTISGLNGGVSHTYTVVGDPSILFNVNGSSSTILAGTSANDIVIGDDNASASGGSGANLFIGLGVNAVLTGAGTSNQFAVSTPNTRVTVNNGAFFMVANSCLDVVGNANTVNAGTAANDVITLNSLGGSNQDRVTISNGILVLATGTSAVTITGTGNQVGNAAGTTGGTVTFANSNNTARLTNGAVYLLASLAESVNGAGNQVFTGGFAGDTITLAATGAAADRVNMTSGTLVLRASAAGNVYGDHDTLNLASGDALGAYGQGETINGATKCFIYLSDSGSTADTVNVSGDNTGTAIGGQSAGVDIAVGAAAVVGSNDAITLGASAQVKLASTTGDTVAGLTSSGTNSIDLTALAYNAADTTKYMPKSGSPTTGGVLQILSGTTVVASVTLVGNYTTSSFTLSADGGGHTLIKDPTPGSTATPSPAAMVQAMASLTPNASAIYTPARASSFDHFQSMIAAPRA